ncbi:hypothetical protein L195_g026275 [Trifolium pratense]|uniref:Uncharacterized protein n=1 Tax=Trifolium pratense TaxID=57577 RepID=A0A2K3NIU6_TRIPR|nr:hypothetical protein L195_g026275 [Trifolium pratense]
MDHPYFLYDYHSQYYEGPQDPHKSNLEILMEDFIEAQTLSRLESMMDSNKALETQISLLAHKPLGPFLERHGDVVTSNSEGQIKNPKESDNEVGEGSGEKRVKIEKNPLTPPEREVVEEVEKEAHYVLPPPYHPLIPFP